MVVRLVPCAVVPHPFVKQRWSGVRVHYSSQCSRVFDAYCFILFEHASYHVVQDASMFEVRQFHICVKTNFHFEGAPTIQLKYKTTPFINPIY